MTDQDFENDFKSDFRKNFFRILHFWPYVVFSVIFFFLIAFLFLRYTDYSYKSVAVIEIIDKAQDSEMALPTSMTIFNRSMINLQNEFGRLSSYDLHQKNVISLNSNVRFFSVGKIRTVEDHPSDFFKDYELNYKFESLDINSTIKSVIKINDSKMNIDLFDSNDNLVESYIFDELNTTNSNHQLPYELKINDLGQNQLSEITKEIIIYTVDSAVKRSIKSLEMEQNNIGTLNLSSDQIKLTYTDNNPKVAEQYLNNLVYIFDLDGINDRQLEYKRTISFAEERARFLKKEVELIEINKQDFKIKNKLSDIQYDAPLTINRKFDYDDRLFKSQTQINLIKILESEINVNKFNLLPSNFGIDNNAISSQITLFNELIKERLRLISLGAGSNNTNLVNIESQINNYYDNILISLKNYKETLSKSISDIENKENEFEDLYSEIPQKERILREIERELLVKESLYSLLLQKKEEASINNAVVKPTIKIIDRARSLNTPVSPVPINVYLQSFLLSLILPLTIISILIYFDNKIHTVEDLNKIGVPISGEIPFVDLSKDKFEIFNSLNISDRSPIIEGIRMLITNLKYTSAISEKDCKTILVTSSIKGEGKSLISSLLAKVLSFNSKVLLIGADLRNPQLHKFAGNSKDVLGLSDYLYRDDLNFEELTYKFKNLDIVFSGSIPPNPTELLSKKKFDLLLDSLKVKYDQIIIDSAPCLLVADTFQFAKKIDSSILILRSNHTPKEILRFVEGVNKEDKFNNLSLLINALGSKDSYGYSYSYGYKYGYNYGYKYGYGSEK